MASYELTSEGGMFRFLKETLFPALLKVERLPEGFGGFVYRAHVNSHDEHETVIIKHVEDYAARSPSWKLSPARMNFEVKMLALLDDPDMLGNGIVRVPTIYYRDPANHLVTMKDVGALPTLKSWFTPSIDSATSVTIGRGLGKFLAKVHTCTTTKNKGWISIFNDNTTAKDLSSTLYFGRLPDAAAQFGYTDEYFKEVAKEGAREVQESQDVLTLGDFWTGNILVSKDPELRLYAVDFEFAKPGTAEFDIGQMAAEIYCLAKFKDHDKGSAMLDAFLKAYGEERGEGLVDAAKVAIRIGVHLLTVAPTAWRNEVDEGKIREIAKTGAELVKMGWEKDVDKLEQSIVKSLTPHRFPCESCLRYLRTRLPELFV